MSYPRSRFHRSMGDPALLETKPAPTQRKLFFKWKALGACALLFTLSACTISTTRHGWPGSYAPQGIPDAQSCVPFSFGQPTKFACKDGKVYTAQQLRELRQQAAKGVVASSY